MKTLMRKPVLMRIQVMHLKVIPGILGIHETECVGGKRFIQETLVIVTCTVRLDYLK